MKPGQVGYVHVSFETAALRQSTCYRGVVMSLFVMDNSEVIYKVNDDGQIRGKFVSV